jgi:hypothetical protein
MMQPDVIICDAMQRDRTLCCIILSVFTSDAHHNDWTCFRTERSSLQARNSGKRLKTSKVRPIMTILLPLVLANEF